jgi:hypothetical protein
MFTVCPFHYQIYRKKREMSAQPQPNSMNPDIERELARRPSGAYDPAKALAVVAFAVLCAVVLSTAPRRAVEPDDGAYRASIVAMTKGDFLTLSSAQVTALTELLRGPDGAGPRGAVGGVQFPNQWVELSDGRYISEKDPGYPFLAAPFQALGIPRKAPLFYGALACLGLFVGARRWLGRWGGLAAVGLYCSSGAALLFAWRDYMPTFTDASLIAAGSGTLLWAVLATEASSRHRRVRGDRDRDLRPLHRHRDTRLRRRGRDLGVAAAGHEAAPPHAVLVAYLGGGLRRWRGRLR